MDYTPMTLAATDVLAERQRQKQQFSYAHDGALSNNDWIAICARALGLAASDGTVTQQPPEALERFRRQMVRLAATALAAVETLDRTKPLAIRGVYEAREGNEGRQPQ